MQRKSSSSFKQLEKVVINCRLCPRLVKHRETVPLRKQFAGETCWRRPVPGFGDPKASLLILGLAPSSMGGNRTGRIFTGDATAIFLLNALYKAGFANQPYSLMKDDQLQLKDCYLTAAVKCVPPKHHPNPKEFANCSQYLENEIYLLKSLNKVLVLGKMAYDAYIKLLKKWGAKGPFPPFKHGLHLKLKDAPELFASYHPSPQNTYTKKLTEKMLVSLLHQIGLAAFQ